MNACTTENSGSGNEHGSRRQVILAPSTEFCSSHFSNVNYNPESYEQILRGVQRLRGRVYLQDGAIRPEQLSADGRHELPADRLSWHIVTLDQGGSVVACARFQEHSPTADYGDLGVSRSAIAKSPKWGRRLRSAVQSVRQRASASGSRFFEAGGWALDESVRHTMEAFRIAVGAFAWSGLIGRAVGITTATFRNHSADILRKLGGRPMRDEGMELPSYFDPQYDCDMQILNFETDGYAPRFHAAVRKQATQLASANLICGLPVSRTFLENIAPAAA